MAVCGITACCDRHRRDPSLFWVVGVTNCKVVESCMLYNFSGHITQLKSQLDAYPACAGFVCLVGRIFDTQVGDRSTRRFISDEFAKEMTMPPTSS
jgi:hypothetical protein